MSASEVKEINPDEAMRILRSDPQAVLLDVRSTMEYQYVGHPVGAVLVPWMDAPDWQVDPEFVTKVRQELRDMNRSETAPILALCRSGARSRMAGLALLSHGFTTIYNVAEGFEGDRDDQGHRSTLNGWRFRGLPWEQG
jgi:rhodanese-related sulfurtransferase